MRFWSQRVQQQHLHVALGCAECVELPARTMTYGTVVRTSFRSTALRFPQNLELLPRTARLILFKNRACTKPRKKVCARAKDVPTSLSSLVV